jgi:uncharacterized protein YcfJ
MNKKIAAIALSATLFAGQSAADEWADLRHESHQTRHRPTLVRAGHGAERYTDYAKVISATPVYERVEVAYPEEQCWDERVHHRRDRHSPVGTIAGGIIGGVVGNQFGRGSGKAAMTVAGTLLGAAIGREASAERSHGRSYVTYERRCELVDRYTTEERLVGYRVEYRYKGETFVTRTEEHPGRRIPILVSVEPARHL